MAQALEQSEMFRAVRPTLKVLALLGSSTCQELNFDTGLPFQSVLIISNFGLVSL